jgi:signal transduction histidine kinase
MTSSSPDRWLTASRRLLVTGLTAAAAAGLVAGALEAWRVGASPDGALLRAEREVRRRFDRSASSLHAIATSLANRRDLRQALGAERDAARTLFSIVEAAADASGEPIAVTIYDPAGGIRAWSGRASEIPLDRVTGDAALFVAPGPVGLRLVQVVPIADGARRVGAVAAERVISPASALRNLTAGEYVIATAVAPVALRARYEGAGAIDRHHSLFLRRPDGQPLIEASVAPDDLAAGLARSRRATAGVVVAMIAFAIVGALGPLLDRRDVARAFREYLTATGAIAAWVVVAAALAWLAAAAMGSDPRTIARGSDPISPIDLLLAALAAFAIAALAVGVAGRLRVARRGRRIAPAWAPLTFAAVQLGAGLAAALLLAAAVRVIVDVAAASAPDALRFSVVPSEPLRLCRIVGLVLVQATAMWLAGAALGAALAPWRVPRRNASVALLVATLWLLPASVTAAVAATADWRMPPAALLGGVAIAAIAAFSAPRWSGRVRHAPQAGRLLTIFLALLAPALLLYPSVHAAADRATRRLIETQYAPQALAHPQELLARLYQALQQIDNIAGLDALIASAAASGQPAPDPAFRIWSQTALAEARLTSAVELYGRQGTLVSRFALNFPEYTPGGQSTISASCAWTVIGEAAPFGSEERRMLHAERGICQPQTTQLNADRKQGVSAGSILVHVMLDYRALPFLSSQSPYYELFRPTRTGGAATAARDIDLVIYGWGLLPIYTSGPRPWPIDDALFERIYASRQPFWTTLDGDETRHRVYVANDRAGIYVVGYPVHAAFDHLVHLAELATLAALAYAIGVALTAVFTRVARNRPRVGRALLREIRASFSRKLFLAFVAASVVPVIALALVIRQYFADQLWADVEDAAARTAAVAQRVIEESLALERRGSTVPIPITDDVMVWISQVIDQDVNIFDGARLLATSERDLFASGLLPTRTPDDVYRAIVLDRLPSFVGQDAIGDLPYMIAAAPVRAGNLDAILTVPLVPRQREIEREIADLDRGVHLAALLFILLGAAIGLSMAERIGDPVKRLTRATRRIARGDFDARIAVRSADEFRRLVDAFNSMAAELKTQRARLERTHRLEAWAEMARQVAHEIKNPLTPIQLAADHLRRVHADRGEPLSPVLDECMNSILTQVRLLRQIAAEFSSFASSPTARPAPVSLSELVGQVLEPYRAGLAARIAVDVAVPASLPRVHVDRTLIARALTNVIENALHAMPGAGRLSVSAQPEPGGVHLEIRDSGVGMDREALERVFEPYFSTKATGTGLGLTIAQRNVELSGGTIAVESERGRGTAVTIRLPATDADRRAHEKEPHG